MENKRSKGKKKASSDMQAEVEKMIEERRKYYEGLKEIEKLKKAFYEPPKTKSEEIRTVDEMLTILTSAKDSHPGRKIFKKKHKFQCFTLDSLLAENGKDRDDYFELTLLLQTTFMRQENLSAEELKELFYIMSLENDNFICQSCCEVLTQNVNTWIPTLEDIFKVILNWGATYTTMELADCEKSIIFPNYIYLKLQTPESPLTGFYSYNYEKIFAYLSHVLLETDKLSEREKIILAKFTLKIALDNKCQPVLERLKDCVANCINTITQWDSFKVCVVSSLLFDKNEHFHNQVAILMDILPKYDRCNDINACMSLTVLRYLITEEVKFEFPYPYTEIATLIKMIKINPNDGNELYKLYMVIHFLNHIVYHRSIFKNDQTVMEDLKNTVESLKWDVAKSKRVFDADLLKGRISYCSTVWSLFGKPSVQS